MPMTPLFGQAVTPFLIIPVSNAVVTPTDGPEVRCTMYQPKYCAGDMRQWSKQSGEINKEHCAKCPRRDVPEERTRRW